MGRPTIVHPPPPTRMCSGCAPSPWSQGGGRTVACTMSARTRAPLALVVMCARASANAPVPACPAAPAAVTANHPRPPHTNDTSCVESELWV